MSTSVHHLGLLGLIVLLSAVGCVKDDAIPEQARVVSKAEFLDLLPGYWLATQKQAIQNVSFGADGRLEFTEHDNGTTTGGVFLYRVAKEEFSGMSIYYGGVGDKLSSAISPRLFTHLSIQAEEGAEGAVLGYILRARSGSDGVSHVFRRGKSR